MSGRPRRRAPPKAEPAYVPGTLLNWNDSRHWDYDGPQPRVNETTGENMPRTPLTERFWPKVNQDGPIPEHNPELGRCWQWTASTTAQGYGQVRAGGTAGSMFYAHRVAYEFTVGPIPAGLQLDHLCRNRRCVNPAHLEPVTNRENGLRGESFAAINAAKTHCNKGHEFTPENTYVYPEESKQAGARGCRECRREKHRRFRKKRASDLSRARGEVPLVSPVA